MYSNQFFRDLYRHMEWADATVWKAVGSLDSPPDEYVWNTLHHLHATQRAFLDFWSGKPLVRPDPADYGNLTEMRAWAHSFHREAESFLADLDPSRFDETAVVPWIRWFERGYGKAAQPTTLGETLFQVAMHTAYHRGQVNRRMRELGGTPPLVDYIAWVWMDRPRPVWPEE